MLAMVAFVTDEIAKLETLLPADQRTAQPAAAGPMPTMQPQPEPQPLPVPQPATEPQPLTIPQPQPQPATLLLTDGSPPQPQTEAA